MAIIKIGNDDAFFLLGTIVLIRLIFYLYNNVDKELAVTIAIPLFFILISYLGKFLKNNIEREKESSTSPKIEIKAASNIVKTVKTRFFEA